MRILIASKFVYEGPRPVGGVQTWGKTVGDELERQGHTVMYWEPGLCEYRQQFDFGIFSNLKYTQGLLPLCESHIKVSHGIIDDEKGGPEFFAVSEEVANKWGCQRGILRQPIDLNFWCPDENAPGPGALVRHSYRGGLEDLKLIAFERGWDYWHLRNKHPESVLMNLRDAKVVIATGRASLEAMATGAPVVIADNRRYQGPLLCTDSLDIQMKRSYSGRGGVTPSRGALDFAINEAVDQGSLREHVVKHHNVTEVVERILECSR